MSTAHGGGHPGGAHLPDEPGPFEPGLDSLIRALTASGHPHERTGRDAALTAFRAGRQPPHRAGLAARFRASRRAASGGHGHPGRPRRPLRLLLPARLVAVGATGFAVLVGVTAAAYAQVLPSPVQRIAHSVFAPLGVPDGHQAAGGPSALPSVSSGSSGVARPSPTASVAVTQSPSAGRHASPTSSALGVDRYHITLKAARARVPAGGFDLFTGSLSHRGHPVSGIHVQLLQRVAGSALWQVVATGVTGERGRVRLLSPSLTASAAFRLAAPGGARSAAVRVTVAPAVRLRLVSGKLRDRLIVTAPGATPGETVTLAKLVSGTWETVASKPLGPKLRAVFARPVSSAAGYLYRAELPASAIAAARVSNRVRIPRPPGTGASLLQPGASRLPIPGPAPAPSAAATVSPAATVRSSSSSSATATPEPAPHLPADTADRTPGPAGH